MLDRGRRRQRESTDTLRWAFQNLKLHSSGSDSTDGTFVVLHVQPPPSIAAGLSPAPIPFGGPSDLEVLAFLESHQRGGLQLRYWNMLHGFASSTKLNFVGSILKLKLPVPSPASKKLKWKYLVLPRV
ncbi:universal stress protein [Cucumis melo var. makuwa]|uniref:Universal stress protein n=1 Tax=Cucumis melo var. makuwa TaxID=1194695 RepID=A0A5D3C5E4_CUCMM|nr:universal stress protein [Cucumis melo var. makuwa]